MICIVYDPNENGIHVCRPCTDCMTEECPIKNNKAEHPDHICGTLETDIEKYDLPEGAYHADCTQGKKRNKCIVDHIAKGSYMGEKKCNTKNDDKKW